MSDAETKLAAFWAETAAPARDDDFELAVEERIARRRLAVSMGLVTAGGMGVAVGVAAMWGEISRHVSALVGAFDAAGPALGAVTVVLMALSWLNRAPAPAYDD